MSFKKNNFELHSNDEFETKLKRINIEIQLNQMIKNFICNL